VRGRGSAREEGRRKLAVSFISSNLLSSFSSSRCPFVFVLKMALESWLIDASRFAWCAGGAGRRAVRFKGLWKERVSSQERRTGWEVIFVRKASFDTPFTPHSMLLVMAWKTWRDKWGKEEVSLPEATRATFDKPWKAVFNSKVISSGLRVPLLSKS
jgi:hypothetical protein